MNTNKDQINRKKKQYSGNSEKCNVILDYRIAPRTKAFKRTRITKDKNNRSLCTVLASAIASGFIVNREQNFRFFRASRSTLAFSRESPRHGGIRSRTDTDACTCCTRAVFGQCSPEAWVSRLHAVYRWLCISLPFYISICRTFSGCCIIQRGVCAVSGLFVNSRKSKSMIFESYG